MLILVLAANTSFADFPRLASFLARDRFIPRQFANRGDRLAFSNGIIILALVSMGLLVLFQADTHALIPLYALGVFVSFTLSQSGMVRYWFRQRGPGWSFRALLNGTGAAVTGVVAVIIALTKFTHGAWMVVVLIPCMIGLFLAVRRHYDEVARQLSVEGVAPRARRRDTPSSSWWATSTGACCRPSSTPAPCRPARAACTSRSIRSRRAASRSAGAGTRRECPWWCCARLTGRSRGRSSSTWISCRAKRPDEIVTIVLPEFVPARWWQHLLHNQTALLIKGALLFRKGVVVTNVPYHLER